MKILLTSGLANRLRTIVGFRYIFGNDVEFHWPVDSACNGKFEDIFQPLSYVTDIDQNHEENFPYEKYYFVGQDTIPAIIKKHAPHLIPEYLKNANHSELWQSDFIKNVELGYSQFKPTYDIQRKVTDFLAGYNLSPGKFAAMHVRTTDHTELAKKNGMHTPLSKFDEFVKYRRDELVFLATDAADIQQRYIDKCIVYKKITKNDNLRQTSLEDALIDVLIAAKAGEFIGSGYSSYSELIRLFAILESS